MNSVFETNDENFETSVTWSALRMCCSACCLAELDSSERIIRDSDGLESMLKNIFFFVTDEGAK